MDEQKDLTQQGKDTACLDEDFISDDDLWDFRHDIYTDSFETTKSFLPNVEKDVWEEGKIITLINTDDSVGTRLFHNSDIIIVYDRYGLEPIVVSERVYRKNLTKKEWRHNCIMLYKTERDHTIAYKRGDLLLHTSFEKEYIDIIYHKVGWNFLTRQAQDDGANGKKEWKLRRFFQAYFG